MSFKGKVVLVTGASSGIGAATAIEFAKEGAKVAIVGRNVEKLKNVQAKCEEQGAKTLHIVTDISVDEEAKQMIEKVIEELGQLDVLVNNAGLTKFGSLLQGNILEAYDDIMKINVRAQISVTSLAVPHLIKTKGNIINISSVGGRHVPVMSINTPYYLSKAALNHFSRCAALELSSQGVRVNIISPGPVQTDFLENAGVTGFKVEDLSHKMPLKRISQPVEIANMILFLASEKAVGITGAEYVIDNGFLLT